MIGLGHSLEACLGLGGYDVLEIWSIFNLRNPKKGPI